MYVKEHLMTYKSFQGVDVALGTNAMTRHPEMVRQHMEEVTNL